MKNMFKRSLAAVMAVASLAVGMVGVNAFAANHEFWFTLGDKGGHQWSYGNPKDDNEQVAYIHTISGSVSSIAPAYFTLYKSNNNDGTPLTADKISNTKTISSITGYNSSYQIPYTMWYAAGKSSYIYAYAGYSGTTANGYWYS
ncbi:MAG: hypothetical protein NC177_13665 [Ruminococcus flavefaciens]|nr:hypothetical protein [Ruminococcus flavefaciens]